LEKGFDNVETITREELQKVGFGILTEIDVKATMKKKLDLDYKAYKILGACNPQFADKAISAMPEIGLLLPCNVIIYESDTSIHLSIIRPETMFQVVENDALVPLASEVGSNLIQALNEIKSRLK
jgi:uncharacterized protein (DUF302 family)